MSVSPILAKPIFARRWERGPLAVFHSRFRGFAATAHAHAEAQLLVPLSGRMHMVSGGRSHMLGPEGAAWLPGGLPHGFTHVDGRVDYLAIEVDMQGSVLPSALAAAPPERPLVTRDAGVLLLGQIVARELDSPGEGADRVIASCLEAMWVYLERALAPDAPVQEGGSDEVRRVVETILASYAEDLRVPDLANLAGLSPRQLERRFHAELGRTPKRFLTEVRVGAAETMLRESDMPVAQISLAVGFQNPSHFAATFQAFTGRHPHMARETLD